VTPFLEGVILSITGLLLTFVAQGLFILVMLGLKWLIPAKTAKIPDQDDLVAFEAAGKDTQEEERSANTEVFAAIGVAIQVLKSRRTQSKQLGARLEAGRGPWWRASTQERPGPKH
jgi:Na+-transporting methylmalonyl-CoA/oxaloacetate decarboxylase gamma subunit